MAWNLRKQWDWVQSPIAKVLETHLMQAWLVVAAFAICVVWGGNLHRGLWETTEGRYVECAREMLATGQFVEPTLDFQPHWTKPPLTYWVFAAGMAAVGDVEAGPRVVQGCLWLGFLAAVGWVAWLIGSNWQEAWWAIVVTMTSALPLIGVTFLSTDLLLSLWETLGVGAYLALLRWGGRRWPLLMGLAFGLAFLTKGPPGLLPLLAIVPWHLYFHGVRFRMPLAPLAVFGIVGLGWYGLVVLRHPELAKYFVFHEVIDRMASDTFQRNPQAWKPFAMYLPLLAAGVLPWLWAGKISVRQLGQALERPYRSLMALWVGFPLLVFFVAKSRLPLYVLPLVVPLAVVMAKELSVRQVPLGRVGLVVLLVGCSVMGTRIGLEVVPSSRNMRHLFQRIVPYKPQEILLYREEALYGLQAYAGQAGIPVRRILGEDAGLRLRELVLSDKTARVVVAQEKHRSTLGELLGVKDNFSIREGWIVVPMYGQFQRGG